MKAAAVCRSKIMYETVSMQLEHCEEVSAGQLRVRDLV